MPLEPNSTYISVYSLWNIFSGITK